MICPAVMDCASLELQAKTNASFLKLLWLVFCYIHEPTQLLHPIQFWLTTVEDSSSSLDLTFQAHLMRRQKDTSS